MPIDLNAILLPFVATVQREARLLLFRVGAIGRIVASHVSYASRVEEATHSYLEISFTGGAVDVALIRSQAGILGRIVPHPEPMWDMISQELLLTRFLATLSSMTGGIRGSMQMELSEKMFDSNRQRSFGEVFGIIGVFSRAIFSDWNSKTSILRSLPSRAFLVRLSLILSFGVDPGAKKDEAAGAGSGSALDSLPRLLAGALAAMPAAIGWLTKVIRHLEVAARLALLVKLESIERSIFKIREKIIRFFAEDFMDFGQTLWDYLVVFGRVFTENIRFWATVIVLVAKVMVPAIVGVIRQTRDFINFWIGVLNFVISAWDFVRSIDLLPLIFPLASLAGGSLTVGDLLDLWDGRISGEKRKALNVMFGAIELAYPDWKPVIKKIQEVVMTSLVTLDEPPQLAFDPFPDVYPLLVEPLQKHFAGFYTRLKGNVLDAVQTTFDSASSMSADMAVVFDASSTRFLDMGGMGVWKQFADHANQVAGTYFTEPLARPANVLGEAFDQAVAKNGMHAASGVIAAYILNVADWWRERRANRPTSPAILSERARRLRVRVRRLRIVVREADLESDGLLDVLKARMKETVEGAFTRGLALAGAKG